MMRQLTGMDATWLYMETEAVFGHVGALNVFRLPGGKDFDPRDAIRNQLVPHLENIPPFTSRLATVPLNADHPYWVDAENFDVEDHLHSLDLDGSGGDSELCDLVAGIMSRPMDRSRPLWDLYVITGLDDRRFALLWKIHHAAIDGALTTLLLSGILNDEPGPVAPPATYTAARTSVPSPAELAVRTTVRLAGRPARLARTNIKMLRHISAAARKEGARKTAATVRRGLPRQIRRDTYDLSQPMPTTGAPPTPFNGTVTADRSFAFRQVALDDVLSAKNRLECTLNDVVMAAVAGGLRRYLTRLDALPDQPLVGMIPVSIRTGDEPDAWTNRVSQIFPTIPTHLATVEERIDGVKGSMGTAKRDFGLMPADALIEASEMMFPPLTSAAARLATRLKVGDRLGSPVNLVVSNVPGPRTPLYLGPARLELTIPASMIFEGQGLNVTLHSYCDAIFLSCTAATNLVPDLDDVIDDIVAEFEAIFAS